MVAGELRHLDGIEKNARAKRWLEYSTRVAESWAVGDPLFSRMLSFDWPFHPGGQKARDFNFDLGGRFRNDELHGRSFIAEVKGYRNEHDLPGHFRDFLAKCYVVYLAAPELCDNFLWISWAPFKAQNWSEHHDPASIERSLMHSVNRWRVLGERDPGAARQKIDHSAIHAVSSRVWRITLCDEQEKLVVTTSHLAELLKFMKIEQEGRT